MVLSKSGAVKEWFVLVSSVLEMSCVDEVKDVLQEHNILPSSTIESEGEVHAICTALFSTDKLVRILCKRVVS